MTTSRAITVGSITLRSHTPADADGLYSAVVESLDTVGRWLPWCHPGYQRRDAEGWVAGSAERWSSGLDFPFAIVDSQDGRLLGGVGINHVVREHATGNLGYWVRASGTGRGIAPQAATLAARFGLTEGGLARLEIVIPVGNTRSQRVAEKLGAHYEGIARHRLRVRNESVDAWQYSLTRDDLPRLQA
jgi:RimJ/RimL family protein N-acetyltransferase